jgi:hypothetical protein
MHHQEAGGGHGRPGRQRDASPDLCGLLLPMQAVTLTREASTGWSAGSMQGRQCALAASKRAAEASELCHKELIAVFKMNA